jgi:catechol 2,3-dioxygenase-like lactoylglutathione lyase family enzyme
MRIVLSSLLVASQDDALAFYTGKLGFRVVHDIPMGEFRWLTVSSPEGVDGAELVLEPMAFPPAREYQRKLFEAGIPATAFITTHLEDEVARLREAGVVFRGEPQRYGKITSIIFEDGCGNLINLVQPD